eukprot:2610606-Amphidinium_carterae.1
MSIASYARLRRYDKLNIVVNCIYGASKEKNPEKAIAARQAGLPVFLADCTRRDVLESWGLSVA